MINTEHQPYKMSFAVGGLFLNESVEVARLHNPAETWDVTLRRALEEGVTSLPKTVSRRRTLREIVNRISTLNNDELDYLVEGADRRDRKPCCGLRPAERIALYANSPWRLFVNDSCHIISIFRSRALTSCLLPKPNGTKALRKLAK